MRIIKFIFALSVFSFASTSLYAQEAPSLEHGRFVLSGYGDVSYQDSDFDNSAFSGKFVPIFLFQLNDKIHVESEIEFSIGEDGETETELEYADIHYFLTDRTTITAGKFLLPFGQFGPNLHPSWINRLPSAPGIYGGHGGNGLMSGVLPILSDQGVGFQYSLNLGQRAKVFVDLYGVNGFAAETEEHGDEGEGGEEGDIHDEEPADDHGLAFPEIEFESTSGDNNDNKAFGGRVALAFLPQIEIGASFYRSKYDDGDDLEFNASALDINWLGQFWSLRGEYVRTNAEAFIELVDDHADEAGEDEPDEHDGESEDVTLQKSSFDRNGWYLQVAWQLRQLSIPRLNPLELVVRTSRTREVDAGKRWTVGLNYWLSPSAVLKLAYEDTEMNDGRDDTRVFLQLSYGF